ncbi:hypothetical protein ACWT_4366 [Actinoplanes sp. SE50]|uniref:DUF4352 domain-containing protein n=1 Tax=unclassified Actinoplanes TaxID=2626549 RepID=UPI00023EC9A8|nr:MULTISPECIES: DUF4352 domain-containing protein [unclassified Actinoplanes]AEV85386.1 hypothetical protein ACPL_4495 [Actinoplanes sp. SE50/110]ATO83781.1 hypothetical protein ACWT_4366 [Actinoplanes sp. SE50]SLM01189.1 hypothetical protein ACSP50_4424 [Actinoplanes sp. SE50/110]
MVSLSVRNVGDRAQMFSGSNQKALDSAGTEFQNDGAAEMDADDHADTFLNDINPGNRVSAKVVFDVPRSTTLTRIEWHDSARSRGVKVAPR